MSSANRPLPSLLLLNTLPSREPPLGCAKALLISLGERGKADGVLVDRERGVDVLHERVAKQPHAAAEADVLARERADTLARTR